MSLFDSTPDAADPFDTFWALYPRKTAKEAARKAYRRIRLPRPSLDTLVAALAWQSRQPQWLKEGGAFIPHPATWLNARQWEDVPFQVADTREADRERGRRYTAERQAERDARESARGPR